MSPRLGIIINKTEKNIKKPKPSKKVFHGMIYFRIKHPIIPSRERQTDRQRKRETETDR